MSAKSMHLILVAGGTGGHIFPALAVALEMRRRVKHCSLLWIGTERSREREVCEANNIPLVTLDVQGLARSWSPKNIRAALSFARAVKQTRERFRSMNPDAVIAFGGYVCGPALAAARLTGTPYYLQEQNTVPGVVTRWFSARARATFLGFPLAARYQLRGRTTVTGTPVRPIQGAYEDFAYPDGFDVQAQTVLICGGSQGAASMNTALLESIAAVAQRGVQIVWQTGKATCEQVRNRMKSHANVFVFESIPDLYPFYARAKLVVCRAGASTLSEVAYFGLPCVLIPLPWSAEDHQWMNAGFVENQGWGVRIAQDHDCGTQVKNAIDAMLGDMTQYEGMCRKALDSSPTNAAADIVETICREMSA